MAKKKETDRQRVRRRTQDMFNKFEYASVLLEKFNIIAVKLIREERAKCKKQMKRGLEEMERYYEDELYDILEFIYEQNQKKEFLLLM